MSGSGYRRAPALVRRGDGQTVQLTPLLYQLLTVIDGKHGYEELAQVFSERSGRLATAEDVRFLTEAKLRPLGLLRRPDGTEPVLKKANPLLALRLKLVASNPTVTNRIAPSSGSRWSFHEMGHAAACRFSGAQPSAMGVGLYLVWPAFYTDVTDAYRLERGGRLRVDLGGLYFNAIFGIAMLGLWALVGWDALLLVVAAQPVQMVRQLIPVVRFDGYHILADITGVPDLFHHIKPTLLGLIPRRGRGLQPAQVRGCAPGHALGADRGPGPRGSLPLPDPDGPALRGDRLRSASGSSGTGSRRAGAKATSMQSWRPRSRFSQSRCRCWAAPTSSAV